MSAHRCKEYDDTCVGCQPTLVGLSEDSREMRAVAAYWKTVPLVQKQACHRIWCFNSRVDTDLAALRVVAAGIQAAVRAATGN